MFRPKGYGCFWVWNSLKCDMAFYWGRGEPRGMHIPAKNEEDSLTGMPCHNGSLLPPRNASNKRYN